MESVVQGLEQKMNQTVKDLIQKLSRIRTGRASASLLDEIRVNYYGQMTPLKQIANITIPEPRLLIIKPYDAGTLKELEKAILNSGLGLNPMNDGKVIRIPIPELTEERRKELVKVVGKIAEEHRVAARQERKDAIERLRKMQKDKQITEDELHKGQEKIQKKIDEVIKKIDELAQKKEQEILEV